MSDVDGITSSAILWLYIQKIAPRASMDSIVHEGKQHGIEDHMDFLRGHRYYDLICVIDAGSNDYEYIEEFDTDFLVIDHHICEYEGYSCLPVNMTLINNQQSKNYPNKTLCGAGMAYKFCEALDAKLGVNYAQDFIDLAALGEIADVMSRTTSETNYIITEGLKNIKNEGLKTLIEGQSFSLKERAIPPYDGLTSTDIGFYIAPLLNAIVRVGTVEENNTAFVAFISPDYKVPSTKKGAKPGDYETAAEQTLRTGKNCKSKQDKIKEKAMSELIKHIEEKHLNDNQIILAQLDKNSDIPNSMTGLIAQNICAKYGKPVLIGRENGGTIKGSGRGNQNFSAVPSFKEYLDYTKYFEMTAGHDNAFGFALPADKLNDFFAFSNKDLPADAFSTCYIVDYIFKAGDCKIKPTGTVIAKNIGLFGNGVDEVKVVIEDIEIKDPFFMGANKDSVKISCNGFDCVRFKDEDFAEKVKCAKNKKLNVYGRFNLNTYGGKESLQLFIDDYELVDSFSDDFDF